MIFWPPSSNRVNSSLCDPLVGRSGLERVTALGPLKLIVFIS